MGKRDALTIVCVVGLTCLCALISLCSYPGTLLGNVDHALYRSFNQAFIASYAAASVGYALIGMRISKRTTAIIANVAFAFLTVGLIAAEGMGAGQDARLPVIVGLFCGTGLSVSTVFWLTLLGTLPERTAILSQGLQMTLGSLLFAFIASIFGKMSWTVSVLLCLVSWGCMIAFLKKSGQLKLKDLPQKSRRRTDRRRTFEMMLVPLIGFALVSFIFGIVEVVAMGSSGSPNGGVASYWGGPLGALAFLLWAYFSSSRKSEPPVKTGGLL
jgi:hypothetical protein